MSIKIIRFLLILLSAASLSSLAIGAYLSIFLHYSVWTALIPLLAFLLVWAVSFFLLNRKAKIFSAILGGIFSIISGGFFLVLFVTTQQTFSLSLEDVDEHWFEVRHPAYKHFSRLSDDQCRTFQELLDTEHNFVSIHHPYSHRMNTQFLKEHTDALLKQWNEIMQIDAQIRTLLRSSIDDERDLSRTHTDDILANMRHESRDEYHSLTQKKHDIITEIKTQQHSLQAQKERSQIFTPEYLTQYRAFLAFVDENNRNNASKIACHTGEDDMWRMERIRILTNHIILSALYQNTLYVQESIDILAAFLEHQKEKYTQRSYSTGMSGLSAIAMNIALYSIGLNGLEYYVHFSHAPIDASNILNVLQTFDEKEEYIAAIQNDYWELKRLIGEMEGWAHNDTLLPIPPDTLKAHAHTTLWVTFYDPEETRRLLRHLYVAILREVDDRFPALLPIEVSSGSPVWDFVHILEKTWGITLSWDAPKWYHTLRMRYIPNSIGRLIIAGATPAMSGYKARMMTEKWHREQIIEMLTHISKN